MKTFVIALLLQLSLFADVSIGEKAPEFMLGSMDSQTAYSLNSLQDKVVLLNIWASWCSGCKQEMPKLIKLQNDYHSKFQIVAVNIDKNPDNGLEFLQEVENKIGYMSHFINLHDPKKSVPKLYSCMGMPSSYLIDKHGIIRDIIIGSVDENGIQELKTEIEKMEKE
ncbi:TlpA family protein disulfide reductase [bacterium]|nr:TlpA family protein disulfide reductase [bacterium]MBU1884537.1 TlpA family protein disulfide reductase [bacterium]